MRWYDEGNSRPMSFTRSSEYSLREIVNEHSNPTRNRRTVGTTIAKVELCLLGLLIQVDPE